MKIRSFIPSSATRAQTALALSAVLLLLGTTKYGLAASAADLLEKGIYTEETKGDLPEAIRIYEQIVNDPGADRSLAGQAQLRRGLCELKLGHKPKALSVLEQLTQDFPDPEKLRALVEQQMPQLLEEIVTQIERNYLQEMDRNDLMETAIRAIVGKQTGFLRPDDIAFLGTNEVSQMNQSIEQKFGGIGAVLKSDEAGEVLVRSILPDSPALKAGLQGGDRIVSVDGKALARGDLKTAVELLRGDAGTEVAVGVKREGLPELQEIKLRREIVRVPSVFGAHRKPDYKWEFMLDEEKTIGYIGLSQIGKQSPAEMRAALNELTSKTMKGLILDLRDNPGGTLAEAVAISDLFVESGRILTVKGRSEEQVFNAKTEGTYSGFPMVVLVNRRTASAAEIIAACLQDHQRAIVVGERTYGQALVRSLIPLNGGTALKIPVAAYYRPNGKNMNRYPRSKDSDDWGVTPDKGCEVAFTIDELKQYDAYREQRGFLRTGMPAPKFEDRQLQKALECLRQSEGK